MYPVERFIREDLGLTPYKFSLLADFTQQNISKWKTKDRSVASLPIQLLDELSYLSDLSYSTIRNKLALYEIEYSLNQLTEKEGNSMAARVNEQLLTAFLEAGSKFGASLAQKNGTAALQKLVRNNSIRYDNPADKIESFLNLYLEICIKLHIASFEQMTTLKNQENGTELITNFLIGANNGFQSESNP